MPAIPSFYYQVKTFFTSHPKTTWGKNELLTQLDQLYIQYLEDKAK